VEGSLITFFNTSNNLSVFFINNILSLSEFDLAVNDLLDYWHDIHLESDILASTGWSAYLIAMYYFFLFRKVTIDSEKTAEIQVIQIKFQYYLLLQ